MTAAACGSLVVAGICAAVDWFAVARSKKHIEYLFKPAALIALIGVALTLDTESDAQRSWFVLALLLSLAGDIALMLPRDLFVAGLAAFLLGHVAYIVGFVAGDPSGAGIALAAVPVAIAGIAIAPRILRGVSRAGKELLAPVIAYMLAISIMTTLALGSGWLAGGGAVLFYASDSLIAWDRFVERRAWMRVAIIVTYHLGQAGLAGSLVA